MPDRSQRQPEVLRGALAGLAAGLVASIAMTAFQKLWSLAVPMPKDEEPSTVQAAQAVSRVTTGGNLSDGSKKPAANAVHYLFGGALGAAYGVAAEYWPAVTTGFGTLFGLGSSAAFDEAAVPAAGLSKPPVEVSLTQHVYGFASHLVYGSVTEGVRRALRA